MIGGKPGASLAGELVDAIPDLRSFLGPRRTATVIFDRGGWSPVCFQALIDAGLHVLTYRKAPYDQLPENAFRTITWTGPDGKRYRYRLADQSLDLPLDGGGTLRMRQVTKQTDDGVRGRLIDATDGSTIATTDTFDAMLARLDEAFEGQQRFIQEASHELRNPLAVIRTNLDVALADPHPDIDELRHTAELVAAAAARGLTAAYILGMIQRHGLAKVQAELQAIRGGRRSRKKGIAA